MDFLNVLSLAIGMITVYLVLALSVTAFNEAIAALLSSRGKWLRRGVASLFSNQARDHGNMAIACKVYDSPYIAYLQRGSRFLPSYLPAWTLLQGMLEAASTTRNRALSTLDDLREAARDLPEGRRSVSAWTTCWPPATPRSRISRNATKPGSPPSRPR